ncbi:MAG: hypothetical protein D6713_09010 [Deltaproteobacteria bacterium]|nr:MAG: hypothetical protein D6713_09010 [Deltaproteobacteria bacterium]
MKLRRKRMLYQFLLNLVASVFIGICVYGIIVFWGTPKKINPYLSVGLGLIALLCVGLIGIIGPRLDRIDLLLSEEESSEVEEA